MHTLGQNYISFFLPFLNLLFCIPYCMRFHYIFFKDFPMSKVLKDSAPMCIVRDIIIGGSQLVVHMFCRQVQQNRIQ